MDGAASFAQGSAGRLPVLRGLAAAVAGVLAATSLQALAQPVYKSVDKDGSVSYTSAPPAAAATPLPTRSYARSWEYPEVAAVRSQYDAVREQHHRRAMTAMPPVLAVPRTPTVLSGGTPQPVPWTGPAWRRGGFEPNLPPAPPVDSERRHYYAGR